MTLPRGAPTRLDDSPGRNGGSLISRRAGATGAHDNVTIPRALDNAFSRGDKTNVDVAGMSRKAGVNLVGSLSVGMGTRRMQEAAAQRGDGCLRRAVLGAGFAMLPLLAGPARAQETAEEAASKLPQIGDHLVFLTGSKPGEAIRIDDLVLGDIQTQAYPADPGGHVRNGSRLNLLIVARVGDEGMSDETRARSVDGVVAYSGVCTHQACPVNQWSKDLDAFFCSCHGSAYNPKVNAEVIAGPAPRRLAALPLKSENGLLIVAGGFNGRVGMQQS